VPQTGTGLVDLAHRPVSPGPRSPACCFATRTNGRRIAEPAGAVATDDAAGAAGSAGWAAALGIPRPKEIAKAMIEASTAALRAAMRFGVVSGVTGLTVVAAHRLPLERLQSNSDVSYQGARQRTAPLAPNALCGLSRVVGSGSGIRPACDSDTP
jgi:hypothetical protein